VNGWREIVEHDYFSARDMNFWMTSAQRWARLQETVWPSTPRLTGLLFRTFIHSVFCLTTGSKPPPKRFLHIVWSRASSFKWKYPLLSLRSSSSFLRLLPHRLVTLSFLR
jgi:hypothetical protein